MASRIKGITIEILGKTDGLVKSLGQVNKELSTTQKNLKTVEQALKLDPIAAATASVNTTLLSHLSRVPLCVTP